MEWGRKALKGSWKPVKVTSRKKSDNLEDDNNKKHQNITKKKLKWPPSKEDTIFFKKLAEQGHQYDYLKEMIPPYEPNSMCDHDHTWSQKCPKEQGWVDSKNIKILHNSWIKSKERVSYYRETEGCLYKCRYQYTGEHDFLLSMSSVYSSGKL